MAGMPWVPKHPYAAQGYHAGDVRFFASILEKYMLKCRPHRCLFALFLITPAWAQGHKPATALTETDSAAVERGQAQFRSSCGFCHGEDATGSRAPDLVRSSIVGHDEQG